MNKHNKIKYCFMATVLLTCILCSCGTAPVTQTEIDTQATESQATESQVKDSESSVDDTENKETVIQKDNPKDIFKFGHYEQDNNPENGPEEITWVIASRERDKILLISKYGLDCKVYSEKLEKCKWEDSYVRAWLNDTFYNTAFTSNEKAEIIADKVNTSLITITNGRRSAGGTTVVDNVFLPNTTQFNTIKSKYATCIPTEFAVAQGIVQNEGECSWILRESMVIEEISKVVFIDEKGNNSFDSSSYGVEINTSGMAIRPAIWVSRDLIEDDNEWLTDGKVGDVVRFGKYKWIICGINSENKHALLLSQYVIDSKPFDEVNGNNDWNQSSLKEYLNGEFYNETFSASEKVIMVTTSINGQDCHVLLPAEQWIGKNITGQNLYGKLGGGEAAPYWIVDTSETEHEGVLIDADNGVYKCQNVKEPGGIRPVVMVKMRDKDKSGSNSESGSNSKSDSSSSFTNKYGTPTTVCAHAGCSNYIAASGDTNCCTTHSNKCLNCGAYIDEDAMYCMSCLEGAAGKK